MIDATEGGGTKLHSTGARPWAAVLAGALGASALVVALAAGPDRASDGGPSVRVSDSEVIDLSRVSRISRSEGEGKTVITFYFATEGQLTNFAIAGESADAVWTKVTSTSQDWSAAKK